MPHRTPDPRLILACGAAILAISLGVRHGFGLFLQPISAEYGWPREVYAFALAIQNLVWGVATPFTGMIADRWGAGRAIVGGAIFYTAGLALMAVSTTGLAMTATAGVMIGLGLAGTSFSVVFGAVGRAFPAEKRSLAMGVSSAVGSFGQFAMVPGTLGLMEGLGWAGALVAMGGVAAIMAPLAWAVSDSPRGHGASMPLPPVKALAEAARQKSFWLLSFGYFVCGFQVVFIGIHLPTYLLDRGMDLKVGTTVLALVGLFNIVGTYSAGWLGQRMSKPVLLAAIYGLRSVAIIVFLMVPLSTWSAYVFGIAMGLLWLSTVPLTTGVVATMFGVGNLAMLGGVVFLSHQLGSFAGGWMGGYLYDTTGSYDVVWMCAIALGFMAFLLNLPIRERPVARLAAEAA